MFEIAMLINNRIKIKVEEFYKREKQNKENYSIEGSINPQKIKFGSKLGNELMELSSHEYREFQEIKNTTSIYLREVFLSDPYSHKRLEQTCHRYRTKS